MRTKGMMAITATTDAAAGVTFTGCGAGGLSHRAADQAGRRQVKIGGARIRTVDMHAHCAFPEINAMLGQEIEKENRVSCAERLRDMDAQGIDVAALSINAFWYGADRDVATALIARQNEKLAELCADHPDRFVAFATIALQYPDLAVEQIDHGVRHLGLRGVSIGTSVAGAELSDPKFHPVWAKVEELDCPLFMHPFGGTPGIRHRLEGNGGLNNVIANPLETTIALAKLIMEGTLDRFPGLKLCTCHGGGFLPFYPPRLDAMLTTFPERQKVQLKKKPSEYLSNMYHDTIVFTPEALAYLVSVVGADHVYLGSDYPFKWAPAAVDLVLETAGLGDDEREAILGGTAARLLGLDAS
jgi:aminocarboxymuconate-semialdehyde decarboxylase